MVEMKISPCGFYVEVKFDRPIAVLIDKIKAIRNSIFSREDKVWRIKVRDFVLFYESVSDEFLVRLDPYLRKIRDKNTPPYEHTFTLPVVKPEGFKDDVSLKPYQLEALSHALHHFRKNGTGSIIALPVGAGKTMVGMGFQRAVKMPALLICPTSIKVQWSREIEKFTDATFLIINGDKKKREKLWLEARSNPDKYDFLICNYEQVVNDYELVPKRKLVIIDEAHRYKNPKSKRSKALNDYKKTSDVVLMLTGTFLINQKYDAWNLVHYSGFTFEKSFYMFCQKHCQIDGYGNVCGTKPSMRPFMNKLKEISYYRSKEELMKHLPPRNPVMHWLEMGSSQKKFYEDVKYGELMALDNQNNLTNLQVEGVWARLRQAATIPSVIKKEDLAGDFLSLKIPDESTKLDWLGDFLEDFDEEYFILYCPFTSVLDEIQKKFPKEPWRRIDGSTKPELRQKIIDEGRSSGKAYFLITDALKEGANMQFCNHLIFFSLPLTDADRAQIEGRIWREGQKHVCNIHYVLTLESVDVSIYNMLLGKRDLMQRFGGTVSDNLLVLRSSTC